MQKKKMVSGVLVFLAGCLWGSMGFWVRHLNEAGFTSMEIVALRVYGALFLVGGGAALFCRKVWRIRLRDAWCFLGTGIASIVFFNFCYFTTIVKASLSLAAVLLYTSPVFVILLSALFFGEKLSWRKAAAMALAFAGCLLATGVLGQKLVLSGAGILTGLGAGFGYALYSIFSRFAMERGYGSATITIYTFLAACIGVAPFLDWKHFLGLLLPEGTGHGTEAAAGAALGAGTAWLWLIIAGLVLFTTVAAYLLYTKGLAGLENGQAAVIACVEPVMASAVGFFVFGEKFTAAGAAGALCVLGAVLLINGSGRRRAGAVFPSVFF